MQMLCSGWYATCQVRRWLGRRCKVRSHRYESEYVDGFTCALAGWLAGSEDQRMCSIAMGPGTAVHGTDVSARLAIFSSQRRAVRPDLCGSANAKGVGHLQPGHLSRSDWGCLGRQRTARAR